MLYMPVYAGLSLAHQSSRRWISSLLPVWMVSSGTSYGPVQATYAFWYLSRYSSPGIPTSLAGNTVIPEK